MRRRILVLVVVAITALAACGGGDDDGARADAGPTSSTTAGDRSAGDEGVPGGDGGDGTVVEGRVGDYVLSVELPAGWVGGTCDEVRLGNVAGVAEELCANDTSSFAGAPPSGDMCEDDPAGLSTTAFLDSFEVDDDKVPQYADHDEGRGGGVTDGWLLHRYYIDDRSGCAGGEMQVIVDGFGRVDVSIGAPPALLDEEAFTAVMDSVTLERA